jgi:FkbM family methyltransferase
MTRGAGICVAIAGGVRVCVPDDIGRMTPYVLQEQQDWFEDEIRFLRTALRPGDRFVDIGANFGVYTLTAATLVGPGGRVWAFEPAAATVEWLRQSLRENRLDNVEVIAAAVSSASGRGMLAVEANSELNRLRTASETGEGESVRLVTLDEVASQLDWSAVDVVKIDAEGHEAQVIDGGREFFATRSPLIMCEIKAGSQVDLGPLMRLAPLGYASYRLVPALEALVPVDLNVPPDGYQLNLFCCKPDRAEQLARAGRLARSADEALPSVTTDGWREFLRRFTYGRQHEQIWRQQTDSRPLPGWDAYRRALDVYAHARATTDPVATRYACLRESYRELVALVERHANLPRLLSLVRVAADLGHRQHAVGVLRHLLQSIQPGAMIYAGEPFLVPSAEFETIDPGDRVAYWMLSSAFDRYERLRVFSSYFSATDTLAIVSRLKQFGFCTAAMERRSELVRRRFPSVAPA